jgi:two-component system, cell cycle response regulator CpdR
MAQSLPRRATALIVEDDRLKREAITTLLEQNDFDVINCENAEAAAEVLQTNGAISFLLTDVHLNGAMDGIELAHYAHRRAPRLKIMVMSERPLVRQMPDGSRFYARPWHPTDVLREARL